MIGIETKYEELKNITFGKKIGTGIHREVFLLRGNSDYVIKYAPEYPNINVLEEEVWQTVAHTPIAKWFAPCHIISECGIFLTQRRAETRPRREYPQEVPAFFTDLKYSNYGWIGNQIVCVDYASVISTSMSHKWNPKMKKAEWWEG